MQRPNHSEVVGAFRLPMVGPEEISQGSCASLNHRIRPPPVDDVNNLGHDDKCQRCFTSTAIQIRRNALFTSPEYALTRQSVMEPSTPATFTCAIHFGSRKA